MASLHTSTAPLRTYVKIIMAGSRSAGILAAVILAVGDTSRDVE